jgi:hypothetical protein
VIFLLIWNCANFSRSSSALVRIHRARAVIGLQLGAALFQYLVELQSHLRAQHLDHGESRQQVKVDVVFRLRAIERADQQVCHQALEVCGFGFYCACTRGITAGFTCDEPTKPVFGAGVAPGTAGEPMNPVGREGGGVAHPAMAAPR